MGKPGVLIFYREVGVMDLVQKKDAHSHLCEEHLFHVKYYEFNLLPSVILESSKFSTVVFFS